MNRIEHVIDHGQHDTPRDQPKTTTTTSTGIMTGFAPGLGPSNLLVNDGKLEIGKLDCDRIHLSTISANFCQSPPTLHLKIHIDGRDYTFEEVEVIVRDHERRKMPVNVMCPKCKTEVAIVHSDDGVLFCVSCLQRFIAG